MPRKKSGEELLPYKKAKRVLTQIGLKDRTQYQEWWLLSGKEYRVPMNANSYYRKEGWVSWDDYLGLDARKARIEKERQPQQGRTVKRIEKPGPQPDPYRDLDLNVQKINWRSRLSPKNWDYNECRIYVGHLECNTEEEMDTALFQGAPKGLNYGWWNYEPEQYEYGWKGWDEFLGISDRSNWKDKGYVSLWDSRQHVWSLGLRSKTEWENYCAGGRLPSFIPSNPDVVYRDSGWTTWDDWLQYRTYKRGIRHSNPTWYNIDRARAIAWNYRIEHIDDWMSLCVMDMVSKRIPTRPDLVYPEWEGWDWFFGPTYADHPYIGANFEKEDIFRSKWHYDRHLERFLLKISNYREECIPSWADRKAIAAKLKQQYKQIEEGGEPLQIDMIIPSSNSFVCGLVVPDNLDILGADMYHEKAGRFVPHIVDEDGCVCFVPTAYGEEIRGNSVLSQYFFLAYESDR